MQSFHFLISGGREQKGPQLRGILETGSWQGKSLGSHEREQCGGTFSSLDIKLELCISGVPLTFFSPGCCMCYAP